MMVILKIFNCRDDFMVLLFSFFLIAFDVAAAIFSYFKLFVLKGKIEMK